MQVRPKNQRGTEQRKVWNDCDRRLQDALDCRWNLAPLPEEGFGKTEAVTPDYIEAMADPEAEYENGVLIYQMELLEHQTSTMSGNNMTATSTNSNRRSGQQTRLCHRCRLLDTWPKTAWRTHHHEGMNEEEAEDDAENGTCAS
uniref:Uncharacterized protein n=1 Tax=Meloidogyne javanica TaxID=6303 RepID=A0A915MI59_MELJA